MSALVRPVVDNHNDGTMRVWAYVFITTRQPKRVLRAVRQIRGVLHADAIFGTPDVIAIVSGADIAAMDAVIDDIAEIPDVAATDSKVARWIDNVEFPLRT
jgi:DNA-binding Lrp family transcriptional regulator